MIVTFRAFCDTPEHDCPPIVTVDVDRYPPYVSYWQWLFEFADEERVWYHGG